MRKCLATVLLSLSVLAAAPVAAYAQEVMRVEPITIVTTDVAESFNAEVADSDATRERGLMFRQVMPKDQAMLFDFEQPRPVSMWMKNTLVSLDMLFVRADGSIAALAENTVPKSLDTIGVQEPVRAVVELAAGTLKRVGVKKGDHVVASIFGKATN